MEVQRTVLSREADTDYPHVLAADEELRSIKFLHLNPAALRQPSSVNDPASLARDGRNLPATLARMQAEDKFALTDVSRDMANLVPGISKIKVEKNQASNEYDIRAETSDHRSFSAQVLSDGTLRLLALATLRNDPQFHGVLCIEEPENGVQPLYLENMARIFREMATDFNDPQQIDEPLRQVLVTTHSPAFISLPEVIDSLLFTHIVTRGGSGQNHLPIRVTRMVPVITPNRQTKLEMDTERDRALEVYTIDMVRKYLSSDNLDEARDQLEKARLLPNRR